MIPIAPASTPTCIDEAPPVYCATEGLVVAPAGTTPGTTTGVAGPGTGTRGAGAGTTTVPPGTTTVTLENPVLTGAGGVDFVALTMGTGVIGR